jgi:Squalene epoxidase
MTLSDCSLGMCSPALSDCFRVYARPLLLAFHFYAVALYSIILLFRKASVVNYPGTVIKGFGVLAKACVVFIPVVISELLP